MHKILLINPERGRDVTILDNTRVMGESIPIVNRVHLMEWLGKKGVLMMPDINFEKITDHGIRITTSEGIAHTIEADTIIPAMPLSPDTKLLNRVQGLPFPETLTPRIQSHHSGHSPPRSARDDSGRQYLEAY